MISTTLKEIVSKSTLRREFQPAMLFCLDHTHYSLLEGCIMLNYSEIANQTDCMKYQGQRVSTCYSYMY